MIKLGPVGRLLQIVPILALLSLLIGCDGIFTAFRNKQTKSPADHRKMFLNKRASFYKTNKKSQDIVELTSPRIAAWYQGGGNSSNNPGHLLLNTGFGRRLWKVAAGQIGGKKPTVHDRTSISSMITTSGAYLNFTKRKGYILARPISAGGRVFVYDQNGNVSSSLLSNGRKLWSVNLSPKNLSSIATNGGGLATDGKAVYVATGFGNIIALQLNTGALLWKKKIPVPAQGSLAIGLDKVYFVTQNNDIIALNVSDGSKAWEFRGFPGGPGAIVNLTNPAIAEDYLVAPLTSGELIALDAKTGKLVWRVVLSTNTFTALAGIVGTSSTPAIDSGIVYVTGAFNSTIAFHLEDGYKLWEIEIGSVHTPIVSGNTVFIVDMNNIVSAVNSKTGNLIWSLQLPPYYQEDRSVSWGGPVLANGKLWLSSSHGSLVAIDAKSGRPLLSKKVGHTLAHPIVAHGRLLLLNEDGFLEAFD